MEAIIYNHQCWISETEPSILKNYMEQLLDESGFVRLNQIEHFFQPYGYTCLWLLAESHLAIHTFPEAQKTYVELSSCDKTKYENFLRIFAPSNIKS